MRQRMVLSILLSILFTPDLAAQTDPAAINGTVTDQSGAIVPAAKLEALSLATGLHRETTPD